MTPHTADDELERTLETALDIAEEDRVKYHLREALQLQIVDTDVECGEEDGTRRC